MHVHIVTVRVNGSWQLGFTHVNINMETEEEPYEGEIVFDTVLCTFNDLKKFMIIKKLVVFTKPPDHLLLTLVTLFKR